MFMPFFLELKAAGVPVSLREYLACSKAWRPGSSTMTSRVSTILARAALVKDERHIDRFDQVFAHVFKGVEALGAEGAVEPRRPSPRNGCGGSPKST